MVGLGIVPRHLHPNAESVSRMSTNCDDYETFMARWSDFTFVLCVHCGRSDIFKTTGKKLAMRKNSCGAQGYAYMRMGKLAGSRVWSDGRTLQNRLGPYRELSTQN